MLSNHRNFVARPPRHEVATPSAIRIEVRRCDVSGETRWAAALVDFSRQGMRVSLDESAQFEIGSRLVVQMESAPDFVFRREVTIRWRSVESPPEIVYGCGFDKPVEWEILGELLLRGVLSMD